MAKETTLQLRLSSRQKQILSSAAKLKHKTVTSFVLENACCAAEDILEDQTHFVLNEKQWHEFCEMLDAPAEHIPTLAALLNDESI